MGGWSLTTDGNSFRRDVITVTAVLTLGTVGNAILPIPSAFAVTGATAGTLFLAFVALTNVYTCKLLLRGAVTTGAVDYEGLSHAVGGTLFKLWSEFWIMILLLGTNMGALIQLGEGASFAISNQWPDAPEWLYARHGIAAVIFFTLCVIFPLCMLPNMRKLELVGATGSIILWVLAGAVVIRSCIEGLPALKSGDFPAVGFTTLSDVSTAFSLFCFAFYHQVLMLPMLAEMPNEHGTEARNRYNTSVVSKASTLTILVTSGLTYWFSGWFGAALYGYTDTAENILENEWIPGVGTFILNLCVTIYLAISIPPIFHANMHTANKWFIRLTRGRFMNLPWWQRRFISLMSVGLPCLGVALAVPGQSATVLSVTGATGVAMQSYITPVIIHLALYFGKARCQRTPFHRLDASHHDDPEATKHSSSSPKSGNSEVEPMHPSSPSPLLPSAAGAGSAAQAKAALSPSPPSSLPGEEPPAFAEEADLVGFAGVALPQDPEQDEAAEASRVEAETRRRVLHIPSSEMLYAPLPYRREWRHKALEVVYELVLPVVVIAAGLFFSITTLVYLWVPTD